MVFDLAKASKQIGGKSDLFAGYSEVHTPLAGYAMLLGAWSGIYGSLLITGERSGRLPARVRAGDIGLLGVATHKLTRILTKDWVTAPLRAPFVRYQGSAGGGEVEEEVRGRGLRKAIGDLLTCPWCTGPWVAGALVAGLITRPRATRVLAAGFAAGAISDFLQHAYQATRSASP